MFKKTKLGGFYFPKDYPTRFVTLVKWRFKIKALYRWLRVKMVWPKCVGFQYKSSHDLIEIDITYLYNLRCQNCNRSSAQAPEFHAIVTALNQLPNGIELDNSAKEGNIQPTFGAFNLAILAGNL